jgi:nitrile hydratase accessory protein
MNSVDNEVAYLEGEAALPRKNGELVFQAPWEGRAFGLAVLLSEKGAFPWNDFRARLVEQIGQKATDSAYYESWLDALESALLSHGIVTDDEVTKRAAEYEALERDPAF